MSERAMDLGIELIVEPDVVPKGTVDLRKLDAAPGTPAPARRIGPDGSVSILRQAQDERDTPPLILSEARSAESKEPRPRGVTSELATGVHAKVPAPVPVGLPESVHVEQAAVAPDAAA